MELRLANDEKKEEGGGLKLAGMEPANSLNNPAKEDNPWDFDKPTGAVQSVSISESAPYQSDMSVHQGENTVVKVSGIIMYLAFIGKIVILALLCMGPKIDIYANIFRYTFILGICEYIPFVDAIIVNALYEKKISLYFFAWLLPFFYPGKRDRHVNGGGIGTLLGIGSLIAVIAVFGNMISAMFTYGAKTMVEADKETRTEVAAMLDYPTANGNTLGETLRSSFMIAEATVEEQGGKKIIALLGNGSCMLNSDNTYTMTNKNTPTLLLYEKNTATNTYELKGVTTGNMQLNSPYIKWYQNEILKY